MLVSPAGMHLLQLLLAEFFIISPSAIFTSPHPAAGAESPRHRDSTAPRHRGLGHRRQNIWHRHCYDSGCARFFGGGGGTALHIAIANTERHPNTASHITANRHRPYSNTLSACHSATFATKLYLAIAFSLFKKWVRCIILVKK